MQSAGGSTCDLLNDMHAVDNVTILVSGSHCVLVVPVIFHRRVPRYLAPRSRLSSCRSAGHAVWHRGFRRSASIWLRTAGTISGTAGTVSRLLALLCDNVPLAVYRLANLSLGS